MEQIARPWPALWSLVVGFFMILVDSTIVNVANPKIMEGLNTDINAVIWVTSAYLLAYAVPLLITGRLGDRFGPRNLYLTGLAVFTLASLWCGLAGDIGMLIAARAVQGLGAALMTPQTMAVITRIFKPEERGSAMALWGATAGVATLVGPLLGGLLVDSLGWEWIFFVNVPVGIIGFIAAARFVPKLEQHQHRFDWLGVLLSAVGMFLLVFGLQEGQSYKWGTVTPGITVWGLITAGIVVLVVFVVWQSVYRRRYNGEPLMPLDLFKARNFSLANLGISLMGFTISSMMLPIIFYIQMVRGLTPTQSALLMAPTAVVSGVLAPFVGKWIPRMNPKVIIPLAFGLMSLSLFIYSFLTTPDTPVLMYLIPAAIMGVASSGIWAPMSATALRNLPPRKAGAGSGIYNSTRQVGAVLGSAAIAALIQARLAAELPQAPAGKGAPSGEMATGVLPEFLHAGFSSAMAQSIVLPACAILVAAVASLFFVRPAATAPAPEQEKVSAD